MTHGLVALDRLKEARKQFDALIDEGLRLKMLTKRERDILHRRYIWCRTLDEVGKEFGLTRERIRQIEAKAILILTYVSTPMV